MGNVLLQENASVKTDGLEIPFAPSFLVTSRVVAHSEHALTPIYVLVIQVTVRTTKEDAQF
jgi:hypothetical protein